MLRIRVDAGKGLLKCQRRLRRPQSLGMPRQLGHSVGTAANVVVVVGWRALGDGDGPPQYLAGR